MVALALLLLGLPLHLAAALRADSALPTAAPLSSGALAAARAVHPELVWRAVSLLPPLVALATGAREARLLPGGRRMSHRGHGGGYITEAFFLPAGQDIVTSGGDVAVVWRADTLRPVAGFRGARRSRPLPDGERVASCGDASQVLVWNARSGRLLVQINASAWVRQLWVLEPGDLVLTWADNAAFNVETGRNDFMVWNASTGHALHPLENGRRVLCLEVSPCGRKVVIAGMIVLSVYDGLTGTLDDRIVRPTPREHRLDRNRGSIVRLSRGAKRVFEHLAYSLITVWDLTIGSHRHWNIDVGHPVVAFAVDDRGRRAFIFSHAADVVWDVDAGRQLHRLEGRAAQRIDALMLSTAGDAVATCVQLEGRLEGDGGGFEEEGKGDNYAEDASAVGEVTTQVKVWDAASGRCLLTSSVVDSFMRKLEPRCSVALASVTQLLMNA